MLKTLKIFLTQCLSFYFKSIFPFVVYIFYITTHTEEFMQEESKSSMSEIQEDIALSQTELQ